MVVVDPKWVIPKHDHLLFFPPLLYLVKIPFVPQALCHFFLFVLATHITQFYHTTIQWNTVPYPITLSIVFAKQLHLV
jgi:hypothetical protein